VRPSEYNSLEALFGALVCAPADAAVGRRAMLWTRNRKHYPMKELFFFD